MVHSTRRAANNGVPSPDIATTSLSPSLEQTCFFVCGILASGVPEWRDAAVFVILAGWLTADATFHLVLAQIMALKQKAPGIDARSEPVPLDEWRQEDADEDYGVSPARSAVDPKHNTLPWSQLVAHATTALVGTGLVLSLATYLGPDPLLVAGSGLLIAAALSLLAPEGYETLDHWFAGLRTSVAWLTGHAILAPLSAASVGLALLTGVAIYAREMAADGRTSARWLLRWAWGVLIIATIQAGHPIVTAVVAVSAVADLMRNDTGKPGAGQGWSRLRPRVSWLISMTLVAVASTYWG